MTTSPQNKKIRIGKRLETVAEIAAVRLSCEKNDIPLCAIDVGTDHALLPMYLLSECGFSHITATDINQGPCDSARKNIALAGKFFSDRIDVIKTDGLDGVSDVLCNRIICAGMGGELIRDIISRAAFIKEKPEKICFVLQPQSKENVLRKYLYENGFFILYEKVVKDAGKLYTVMRVIFDGKQRKTTLFEQYFGCENVCERDEIFNEYFIKKYSILKRNTLLRSQSETATSSELATAEKELFDEMKKYISERGISDADNT